MSVSGSAYNGTYHYSTTLPTGSHTFYFMFTGGSSGQTTVWLGWPNQISGPTITASAGLSGGLVNPTSGQTYTTYTFYVNYYDPQGKNATATYVYIDNTPYVMVLYSGSASDGFWGFGTNTLTASTHKFYFLFTSGSSGQNFTFGLPNQISGPTIAAPPTPEPTSTPTPTPNATDTPAPQPTANPTSAPQSTTNPTTTSKPAQTPLPTPTANPTPTLNPTATWPTIKTLTTPTSSIIPTAFYQSNTYPLWAIAAAVIIGVILATALAMKKHQSDEPEDEADFE